MLSGRSCIIPKTRVSVPTSSSSVMKYRLWVPFLRVCCHIRSVALNSGEYGGSW